MPDNAERNSYHRDASVETNRASFLSSASTSRSSRLGVQQAEESPGSRHSRRALQSGSSPATPGSSRSTVTIGDDRSKVHPTRSSAKLARMMSEDSFRNAQQGKTPLGIMKNVSIRKTVSERSVGYQERMTRGPIRKEALLDMVSRDLRKSNTGRESFASVLSNKSLRVDLETSNTDEGLTGEQCITRAATTSILEDLVNFTRITGNRETKQPGTDPRSLMRVVVEDELLRKTCTWLPLTLLVFLVFVAFFQLHYATSYTYLQEQHIRTTLTDEAVSVSDAQGIFRWLNNTWFPFLWSSPNVDGTGNDMGAFANQHLVGGVLLRTARGSRLRCKDPLADHYDCFPEDQRARVADTALNGWATDSRRLSEITRRPMHAQIMQQTGAWLGGVEPWSNSDILSLPSIRRPTRASKTDGERRITESDTARHKARKTKRKKVKGLGTPPKRVSGTHPGTIGSDAHRRLKMYTSKWESSLPAPWGSESTYEKVIPLSMSLSSVQEQISRWGDHRQPLITNQTLFFGVETILKNDNIGSGVLSHVFVNFLFSRGGEIYVQVLFQSMVQSTRLVALFAFFIWIAIFLGWTLILPYNAFIAAQHGACCTHFLKFSNFFEWVLLIMGWAILVLFTVERLGMMTFLETYELYREQRQHANLDTLQEFDESWFRQIYSSVYYFGSISVWVLQLVAWYHIILLFRFLMASRGHVRLAILVNTVSRGIQDLIHLSIIELMILMTYVFSGHIFFGHRIAAFATLRGSVGYCIQILFQREYDWDELTAESWLTSSIWVITFVFMAIIVILSIVLAMIFDSYGEVRTEIAPDDTLWHTAAQLMNQVQHLKEWVSHHELLIGLTSCPVGKPVTKKEIQHELFQGMCTEQAEHLFDSARKRLVASVTQGRKNMLPEAIATILLGVNDARGGVHLMKEWRQNAAEGAPYFEAAKKPSKPCKVDTAELHGVQDDGTGDQVSMAAVGEEGGAKDGDAEAPFWVKDGLVTHLKEQQQAIASIQDMIQAIESELAARGISKGSIKA